jgi:hypothetical protein
VRHRARAAATIVAGLAVAALLALSAVQARHASATDKRAQPAIGMVARVAPGDVKATPHAPPPPLLLPAPIALLAPTAAPLPAPSFVAPPSTPLHLRKLVLLL